MINPLSPQEIADQAKLKYQDGDHLQAARAFGEAATAYANTGDNLMAAEMKNNQSVALLLAGEAQAALDVVEGTEKVFSDSGDFRRQGLALANQASALQALKRLKEAMDCYKGAGDALEKANEGDLRAEVLQLLSALYLRRFKLYDAAITLQSGLAGAQNLNWKQRFMKKIIFIHR